jgi:hypothetical protein
MQSVWQAAHRQAPKKIYRLKEDQANFHFRWNWDEVKKLRGLRLQESFPNLSPHLFRGVAKIL